MLQRADFPFLGFGIGLRRPHYAHILARHPAIDWFEAVTENFMVEGGRPLEVLDAVRAHYPVVMHGVSMSIGSTDALDLEYLRRVRALARRVAPAWVSDHLCWSGVGGRSLHDLLPLPHNEETVRHVAARIRRAQEILGRSILIENVSSYLTFRSSVMSEWEFVRAVAEEADCGILLDINNIFVNSFNHRFSAEEYIDAIPPERVVQFHLAGHSDHGDYLLDSHDHPVRDEVWTLYARAVRRFGAVSTLIEWDDNIPAFGVVAAAAERARRIYESVRTESAGLDATGA